MSLFVKICGITTTQAAEAAIDAGADAIGLVLAESPRQLGLEQAAAIADEVRGRVKVVGVFRRPSSDDVMNAIAALDPDLVQADHAFLGGVARERSLPVFREGEDTSGATGLFLYEGRHSGTGQQVDLGGAARLAGQGSMVLAGGLDPDNVAEAIATVRPAGVDVSSGVETSPGTKDHALITRFIENARHAERMAHT